MMLASFFGGKIITRNGRLGPVISTSAALFGLLSLTYTNSVWLVYVAALVYGFGQVLTFFYMNIAIISWYGVGQSTVLGVAQAATTVGAAVVTPVVASLLESSVIRGRHCADGHYCCNHVRVHIAPLRRYAFQIRHVSG